MSKHKRPRDTNLLAKAIVDIATGEVKDEPEEPALEEGRDPAAVERGRKGGKRGGKARAEKLSPEERAEIARIAATARWKKGDL